MNGDPLDELVLLSSEPRNGETPLDRLVGPITPVGRHYVRNHFAVPTDHPGFLVVEGAVARPLRLSLADLTARPTLSRTVTLECAGNGRAFLDPPPPGEPWGLGAVGTAEWSGVPLHDLLTEAGLAADAVEIRFAGADRGTPREVGHQIAFERSLPVELARRALVAFAMNGRPLAADHGAPFRLVVPGMYGMTAVKWLTTIQATRQPFTGFFQVDRYVIDGRPLGPIAPRAVIVAPVDGAPLEAGTHLVRGYAWSGTGIDRVELSNDGGRTWRPAELGIELAPEAWREWSSSWTIGAPGPAELIARAIDRTGRVQPTEPVWNTLGYGNHAAQATRIDVTAAGG